ncbi:MAG: DUF6850 family outer membrane beta-barrel protein [Bacteroidales bacterium]
MQIRRISLMMTLIPLVSLAQNRLLENPAEASIFKEGTVGEVAISNNISQHKDLLPVWDGKRSNVTSFNAEGSTLTDNGTIWSGFAAYNRGKKRNTMWSNIANSEVFYPYLIADTVGGDYSYETYSLGGSYGQKVKASTLAVSFAYQGALHWRDRDPRPKNTTSDIMTRLGWAYRSTMGYWGAALGFDSQKQHLTISIEEQYRKEKLYHLLGMGLYDHRYSISESSFSRYYRGYRWISEIYYMQQPDEGFFSRASISSRRIRVEESDTRLSAISKLSAASISIGYKSIPIALYSLDIYSFFDTNRTLGFERTYTKEESNSQTGVFIPTLLSVSQPYKKINIQGGISLVLRSKEPSKSQFRWFKLMFGGYSEKESHNDLFARWRCLNSQLATNFRFSTTKRSAMHVELSINGSLNIDREIKVGQIDEVVLGMTIPNFENRSRSRVSESIMFMQEIVIKNYFISPFIRAHAIQGASSADGWGVETGIKFTL